MRANFMINYNETLINIYFDVFQVIEVVKERIDGQLTLGCAIGGGVDQV